ncbi:MAG: nucleoside kinase, partial [Lachnospiraceae bacterium]
MPAVFVNGQERSYPRGTTYENIVAEFQPEYRNHIALVYFNGKMRELSKKLERDGAIKLITTKDPAGHAAYARTAIMMLVRAWQEVTQDMPSPHASLKVEFTLGNAYF